MELLAQRLATRGTLRWGVQPSRVGPIKDGTVLERFANFGRNNVIVRNHSIVEPNTPLGSFVCTADTCPTKISDNTLTTGTISAHCASVADGDACTATCDAGYSGKNTQNL